MPFNAPSSGTYSAVFMTDENACVFQFEAVIGEPIIVPITGLNENFTHQFYILDEMENTIEYEGPGGKVVYDCFKFKLTPSTAGEARMLHMPGVTCENLNDPKHGLTDEQKACIEGVGEACTIDFNIVLHGDVVETITGLNPCEENTITIILQ
jgi:hypothetical protein